MKTNRLCFLLAISPFAGAGQDPNNFDADLSVSTQRSDNAQKQYVQDIKIAERQDIYQLGVKGEFNNDWLGAKSKYSANEWRYSEDSQPNYTAIIGSSQIDLGENSWPAHLKLSHTSLPILNAPGALDLSGNRDELATFSIEPSLHWHATEADRLRVAVESANVKYHKNSEKNSDITSLQLSWLHDLSKIENLSLTASSSDVSFKENPSQDYNVETAFAEYSVYLNRLSYSASLGGNHLTQEEGDLNFSRPYFNVEIHYSNVLNTFAATIDRRISNSSMGSTNGSVLSGIAMETSGVGLDLIDLTKAQLSWSTRAVCDKCTLNLSAERINQDYQVLAEDSTSISYSGSFSYNLGRQSLLTLSYVTTDGEFARRSNAVRAYTEKTYNANYGYKFANKVSLNVFVNRFNRSSLDKFNSFEETVTGIKLAASF